MTKKENKKKTKTRGQKKMPLINGQKTTKIGYNKNEKIQKEGDKNRPKK